MDVKVLAASIDLNVPRVVCTRGRSALLLKEVLLLITTDKHHYRAKGIM